MMSKQLVVFAINTVICGIEVNQVKEVIKYRELAMVPGAAPYIHGIINLRGNMFTVLNTYYRFNLDAPPVSEQTRIILIKVAEETIGIVVDQVLEVIEMDEKQIKIMPNLVEQTKAIANQQEALAFTKGICDYNSNMLLLINVDKLLTQAEWEEMSRL
jgi:purine-binding chemotaxis protein CheW